MGTFRSFADYVARRDLMRSAADPTRAVGDDVDVVPNGSISIQASLEDDGGQVEQRSLYGNLFKGVFTVVNPSRPALPTNSRLLASPFRRKRLKSQVMGR
jgi:hypothetical protein